MLMKGITFQDEPIVYNSIEFVDRLEDAYNPVNYKNIVPGRYQVNPYGYIIDKYTGNILYGTKDRYIRTSLHNTDETKSMEMNHRIVASTYCIKNNEDDDVVNHLDGNKYNNYYENLEWGDLKNNTQHALRMGLIKVAGESPSSKFTDEQVHQICSLLEQKLSYSEILDICNLEKTEQNRGIIAKIKNKKNWRSISDLYNIDPHYKTCYFSDEQLHIFCKKIEEGCNNKEIREIFNIDINKDSKEYFIFSNMIYSLRNKVNRKDITSQYNW